MPASARGCTSASARPLARLELQIALPILFSRHPGLRLAAPPRYADVYHFHGLKALAVQV